MIEKIKKIKQDILNEFKGVKDLAALKGLEVKFMGRKGELTKLLRQITALSDQEKKEIGQIANDTKRDLIKRFNDMRIALIGQVDSGFIDVTLPGDKYSVGHAHPLTQIQEELEALFVSLGFRVLEGPELESDYYNFTALNIPAHHPARDIQDTFYIDNQGKQNENDMVMRTHTSPMQVRAMQKYGAPLRCVVLGRVFRAEATDAVHEHTLHQIEGLMVGRNIGITNLTAVLKEMLSGIFGREVVTRVRPSYFPFVEPGLEVDMQCAICGGAKCPSCKHSGWLEMLGSGMVHPSVLRAGGIDPEVYSGFAFGMGVDRLAMMKYGINDIRNFMGGDLRFLNQF